MIQNRKQLTSHGHVVGRRVVLDILSAGIAGADPYPPTKALVHVEDGVLSIGHSDVKFSSGQEPLTFDLSRIKNIYVVGAGKAAQRVALGLEHALGDRVTDGQINAKKGEPILLRRIGVTLAGHPIPDEASILGAQRMLEIMQRAEEGDIVFFCWSGGATALSTLPAPGLSLHDVQDVYRLLYFGHGATMPAANAVRNLIATLNGRHPRYVRGATLIELSVAEEPPWLEVDLYEPPSPVNSYDGAIAVLKDYGCWDDIPWAIRRFLLDADPRLGPLTEAEVAQRPYFKFCIMGPEHMLRAAEAKAEMLGFQAHTLVSSLSDIEARPVAEVIARLAQEIHVLHRPFVPPCILLCGGEVLVATGAHTGIGGRNQEFALWVSRCIAGSRNIVVASADSDGTDGPTDFAGGIGDGFTVDRIRAHNVDLAAELRRHNSLPVLRALGDAIQTGNTGTNVRDLRVIYVGDDRSPRVD